MGYDFTSIENKTAKWFSLAKEDVVTKKRYAEIMEELLAIDSRISKEITREESVKEIDKLLDEINVCVLQFDNDLEFCTFSEGFYKNKETAKKIMKHELDHAEIYKKEGINYKLGFFKLWNEDKNNFCYQPHIQDFARHKEGLSEEDEERIHKESLENVDEKSYFDKMQYKKLKKFPKQNPRVP